MLLKVIIHLKNKIYSFKNNEKGQSLVQFSIVLPVLIIMFSGVFDLARILDYKILISNAGSECVRYIAEVHDYSSGASLYSSAQSALSTGGFYERLDPARLSVNITEYAQETDYYIYHSSLSGSTLPAYSKFAKVKIVLSYDVKIVNPLASWLFPDEIFTIKSEYLTRIGKGYGKK